MRAMAASKKAQWTGRKIKKPSKSGSKTEEKKRSPLRKVAPSKMVVGKGSQPARKTMVNKPMRKTTSQKPGTLKIAKTIFRVKPRHQVEGRINRSGLSLTPRKATSAGVATTPTRFVVKALSVTPQKASPTQKKSSGDPGKTSRKTVIIQTGTSVSGRGPLQQKDTKSQPTVTQSDAKAKSPAPVRGPVAVIRSAEKTKVVTRGSPLRVSVRSLKKELVHARSPRSPPQPRPRAKTRATLKRSASSPQTNAGKRLSRLSAGEKITFTENGSGIGQFKQCAVRLMKNPVAETLSQSQADSAKEAFTSALSLGKKMPSQASAGKEAFLIKEKVEAPEDNETVERVGLKKTDEKKKMKGSITVRFKSAEKSGPSKNTAVAKKTKKTAKKTVLHLFDQKRVDFGNEKYQQCKHCFLWVAVSGLVGHASTCECASQKEEATFRCSDCGDGFSSMVLLMRHKRQNPGCPKAAQMSLLLKLSNTKRLIGEEPLAPKVSRRQPSRDPLEGATSFVCACKKVVPTSAELKEHGQKCPVARNVQVMCPLCNVIVGRQLFMKHMRDQHGLFMYQPLGSEGSLVPTAAPAPVGAQPPIDRSSPAPADSSPSTPRTSDDPSQGPQSAIQTVATIPLKEPQEDPPVSTPADSKDQVDNLEVQRQSQRKRSSHEAGAPSASAKKVRISLTNETAACEKTDEVESPRSKRRQIVKTPAATAHGTERSATNVAAPQQPNITKTETGREPTSNGGAPQRKQPAEKAPAQKKDDGVRPTLVLRARRVSVPSTKGKPESSSELTSVQDGHQKSEASPSRKGKATRRESEPESHRDSEPESRRESEPVSRRESEPVSRRESEPVSRRESEPVSRQESEPVSRRESEPVTSAATGKKSIAAAPNKSGRPVKSVSWSPETSPVKEVSPPGEKSSDEVVPVRPGVQYVAGRNRYSDVRAQVCLDCGVSFPSNLALCSHKRLDCMGKGLQLKCNCTLCAKNFPSQLLLNKHLNETHNKESFPWLQFCTICNKVFDTQERYVTHVNHVHSWLNDAHNPQNKTVTCRDCHTRVTSTNLYSHKLACQQARDSVLLECQNECQNCFKSFPSLKALKAHQKPEFAHDCVPPSENTLSKPTAAKATKNDDDDDDQVSKLQSAPVAGSKNDKKKDKKSAKARRAVNRVERGIQGISMSPSQGGMIALDMAQLNKLAQLEKRGQKVMLAMAVTPKGHKYMLHSGGQKKGLGEPQIISAITLQRSAAIAAAATKASRSHQQAAIAAAVTPNKLQTPRDTPQEPLNQGIGKPVTHQQPVKQGKGKPVTAQQPVNQEKSKPVISQEPVSQGKGKPVTHQQPGKQGKLLTPQSGKPVTCQHPVNQGKASPVTPSKQTLGEAPRKAISTRGRLLGTITIEPDEKATVDDSNVEEKPATSPPRHVPNILRSRRTPAAASASAAAAAKESPPARTRAAHSVVAPTSFAKKPERKVGISGSGPEAAEVASSSSSSVEKPAKTPEPRGKEKLPVLRKKSASTASMSLAPVQVLKPIDKDHVKCLRCQAILGSMFEVASHKCAEDPEAVVEVGVKQEESDAEEAHSSFSEDNAVEWSVARV